MEEFYNEPSSTFVMDIAMSFFRYIDICFTINMHKY